jgi:hypothetical protein
LPIITVSALLIFLGMQGVPPSRLGFVCKPDMPPHINIFFRARPPLSFAPLPEKQECLDYSGLFSTKANILDRFEKTEPPIRVKTESKRIQRLISTVENIEKNKADNNEKLKECKYNIKYLSVRRYLSIY